MLRSGSDCAAAQTYGWLYSHAKRRSATKAARFVTLKEKAARLCWEAIEINYLK
jgi:hypothetical protein